MIHLENRWDEFWFHVDFNLINHGNKQALIFFFRKYKKNIKKVKCNVRKHNDHIFSLSLSLSVYNEQHLSDAKKAQQSLEGTYKQLDIVSFSLWQVVMETLLWAVCLWVYHWASRSDWLLHPVRGLRHVSLWRKRWGESYFVGGPKVLVYHLFLWLLCLFR